MDPIKNPFAPGAGAPPPALTGRDKDIETFRVMIGRLEAGRPTKSMMLTGLRGVGKTVLLTTFRDTAESQKFITGSTNLVEKIKDSAWKAAGVLKAFSIKIPGGGEIGIDIDALRGKGDSGQLDEDLSDLLVTIGEAAKEKKTGVMFFCDEIQFLKKEDLEALIAATHQLSQRSLPVGIVGAGLSQLPRIAGEAKSYAERLFDFPKIDRLDGAAARGALELPVAQQGVRFEPAAIDTILKFTGGYPYFLQEYGKHVWNIASGAAISKQDVERARQSVIAQLDENFFRVRIDRTTTAERNYVCRDGASRPRAI